jgi:hypothetical protein
MYYQQYNTIEKCQLSRRAYSSQTVTHMTYTNSIYRCTLHIMYGYTLIIHDITLLLTTTHNSQLTTKSDVDLQNFTQFRQNRKQMCFPTTSHPNLYVVAIFTSRNWLRSTGQSLLLVLNESSFGLIAVSTVLFGSFLVLFWSLPSETTNKTKRRLI